MKSAGTLALIIACAGSFASAQTAPQPVEATLADYLQMPITGKSVGNFPAQIARVNFLIEEPGAARLFVSDQTGTLYIVDKNTRQPVSYLNLNGSAEASPSHGTFYTIHLEDMAWDRTNLLAFVIGSNSGPVRYETIDIVHRGANYGYPLREGPEAKPLNAIDDPVGADNTLPLRISDTVVLSKRTPINDPALAYKTTVKGNAIAGGFVYRGKKWPALQGTVVFGDITSGRLFYARMADLTAATDGNFTTTAPYTEIKTDLLRQVQEQIRVRAPAPAPTAPAAAPGGRSFPFRVDMRLAADAAGEIYILTKSDGMVRRVASIQ